MDTECEEKHPWDFQLEKKLVTIKCRIGVDDLESYDALCKFVSTVSERSPATHFVIHARKALLNGLSPDENRKVPPLHR
eukprot:355595-Pyramimonas_sp.AAC.1